jgi:tetratricopeptide (TPR) repeat protein
MLRRLITFALLAVLGPAALSAQTGAARSICRSTAASEEFTRGLTLLHHMTYPQARVAFERAGAADPRCAMARWGIAMTLFQPLWPTRPGPAELRRGRAAVDTAMSLADGTSWDRSLIAAAAAFYREPAADYWERIRRWADAMATAHAAHPADDEVSAFYALALLATAAADTSARGNAERAATLLLGVLRHDPRHPGAQHYLVHANDAPGREHHSPEVVGRYAADAPRNPHALHMPTHIYVRQGEWDAVIAGNRRAADAALEYPAGEQGELVWDEFPHAIEYLVYALLQEGADSGANAQIERLRATARLEPSFKTAFHLSSTAARYVLERRAWSEAIVLPVREPATLAWDRFTWPEAITWFARGLGAVRASHRDVARTAAERLASLDSAAMAGSEPLFARNVHVLRLELDAWMQQSHGHADSAAALMHAAADLETATPKHAVTPAPTLPAWELLGDLLMEQGRPSEALAAYRRSLELYPRRFNGVLGAVRAARAAGDSAAAAVHYRDLLALAPGSTRAAISEARRFAGAPGSPPAR